MPDLQYSLLGAGGPVLWLLIALGAYAAVVFAERLLFLHRVQIRAHSFFDGIRNLLAKGRVVEAITVCEETPGPVAAVVKAALVARGQGSDRIRAAIEEVAAVELPLLERRMGAMAALVPAAPSLGVLGTVLGAIEVFQVYHQNGDYVVASRLAAGVWEALLTTAAGLTLGLLTQMALHLWAGRVRSIARDMEWAAGKVHRLLTLELPPSGDTP